MIKSLIRLALVLVAAIFIYNAFFGTSEEKTQAREVFKKTGEAIGAAWNVLKMEKDKFNAGKYDKVLEKLGDAYREVRTRAQYVDENIIKRIDDLEDRKRQLETELHELDNTEAPQEPARPRSKKAEEEAAAKAADQIRRKEQLLRELDRLVRDTDALLQEANK